VSAFTFWEVIAVGDPEQAKGELKSAEWYAERFEAMKKWLQTEEAKADRRQRENDLADRAMLASRYSGEGSMAFRAQRWIDEFVAGQK